MTWMTRLLSSCMWCGLQQLPKMTWMTRLLSSCMGVACHSASLNIRPSSPWCPVFVQVIYQPPFRQAVSNKLLDKYQAIMKQLLNNKTITMQQDGWSSVQNDPVITTPVVSDRKGYFVDAKDTGTTHKTAESKSHSETTYGCKIRSFVTDNANNMDKMRRELEEEDENLIPYGCLSHVLNLLGQDLTPAPIMKHTVEINRFFRNHHAPSAWMKGQLGSTCPQLPSEPHWKGQLICLDSYLTNRTFTSSSSKTIQMR